MTSATPPIIHEVWGGKVYDTRTATLIGHYSHDDAFLYRTERWNYFMVVSLPSGNIYPLSLRQARDYWYRTMLDTIRLTEEEAFGTEPPEA